MANDDAQGEHILAFFETAEGEHLRAFFESAEGQYLFPNCPFRRQLDCLHQFDAKSVSSIWVHMLGHIIDHRAGQPCRNDSDEMISAINQDGINDELRHVYNDCNNPELNKARQVNRDVDPSDRLEYRDFGPEQRGCFGADAQAELMAEAIRTYMQNPNYLKTVAPNVAARIRAAVNPNPNLNRIIQFN
ncbi:hypothetical protein [Phyllobacterium sp. OV277]|jgi:hypothetical protein|uniref:hypothetical protein n=1 Tax=Phyllobacterium sp. OV277 TaxID=1882772 RepID=UPI00088A7E9A|nr:hypothetical protein [Phyllobacterium sp. OV277]SDP16934.1 hypothetical protein SAMN05443582_103588 [Phyllobacterium sp. OV277]